MIKYMTMLGILSIFLYGCDRTTSKTPVHPNVRLGVQNNVASGLVLLAMEAGYFKKHGVKVELERYPSGKLAYKALLAGEVDLCTVADMPVACHGTHVNAGILATIAETRKGCWITARRDHGINKVTDLHGKKIGTQQNSAVHYFLSMLLLDHKIPASECQIIFMPAVDLPQALIRGEIDAFSMRNPFAAQAKEALGDNIIEFWSETAYLQHFVLVADNDWMATRAKTAEAVMRALADANSLMKSKEEAFKLLSKALPESRPEQLSTDVDLHRLGLSLNQDLILTLESQAQWVGDPDSTLPNFLEIINPDPLRRVNPRLVQLRK